MAGTLSRNPQQIVNGSSATAFPSASTAGWKVGGGRMVRTFIAYSGSVTSCVVRKLVRNKTTGTWHGDVNTTTLDALTPEPQDDSQATYAAKLSKEEARLDWARPAAELARAVRAFNPAPGAWTPFEDAPLKIWSARAVAGQGAPGTVIAAGDALVVATGDGALRLVELQRAGGKPVTADAFLRGASVPAGTRLQ